jgi:mono/diheme cytochrome c family protein
MFGRIGLAVVLSCSAGALGARAEALVERGQYLVDTIMTCHNCHTPSGPNGLTFDKALSGRFRWNEPPFDVTASNITQDKETGIGAWSDADLKTFMTTGVRPNGVRLPSLCPRLSTKS